MEVLIDQLWRDGSLIGVKVIVVVMGMMLGLGELIFDCLDVELVYVLMSINVVKGVEIGVGFDVVIQCGEQYCDEFILDGFEFNNVGGILGGILLGQDIIVYIVLKLILSLWILGKSIDMDGNFVEVVIFG